MKNNLFKLCDKEKLTPDSGYLSRSLIMNLSPMEIVEDDCKTNIGFKMVIQSKNHAKSLVNRYYKILNSDDWQLSTLDFMMGQVGNELIVRSPITCQTDHYKLCAKCFGNYEIVDKKYVGIHSGAVLSERLTQLSMRSCTPIVH